VATFLTLRFLADANGQQRKVESLNWLSANGWHVASETIEQGNMKGSEACCLALICLPFGFAAGRTPNVTVVTMQRDRLQVFKLATNDGHAHEVRRLDDNYVICLLCGLAYALNDV